MKPKQPYHTQNTTYKCAITMLNNNNNNNNNYNNNMGNSNIKMIQSSCRLINTNKI